MHHVDIIIIGSGISGLYSAFKIKQFSANISFLILEKYKKDWIGGRTSNDIFYNTEIVTGAGIGRKKKDKLLYQLVSHFNKDITEYLVEPKISHLMPSFNIHKTMKCLRKEYPKFKNKQITFKEYAMEILGKDEYKKFILNSGYTDYENEDVYETLYHYGMEDNACCWTAFRVPWKKLVLDLYNYIGKNHFHFSSKVIKIEKTQGDPCLFNVNIENGKRYTCHKIIIGSTIDTISELLPSHTIYKDIKGQPFLRLYAKVSKSTIPILKQYISGFTFVQGPLQRIIPMDEEKGVYMIAYNDNENSVSLKNNLKNTKENRKLYEVLLERTLGIPNNSVRIIAIKDYYWPIGTHYYKPLNKKKYNSREEFINIAQHPDMKDDCVLVVGEAVSRNQGWTEGALESVNSVLTKNWINS